MPQKESTYSIPARIRKMENLHIVFWLLKDISWCLFFKPLGLAMILPTMIIAIIIALRNKSLVSETCHNIAIVFWITANSYWMVAEFFEFDEHVISGWITFKHLALIPFLLGILTLAYYYLVWKPRNKSSGETL